MATQSRTPTSVKLENQLELAAQNANNQFSVFTWSFFLPVWGGGHSPEDLVNWTVLHVRWSGCCDSLKDAPKGGGAVKQLDTKCTKMPYEVTAATCSVCT